MTSRSAGGIHQIPQPRIAGDLRPTGRQRVSAAAAQPNSLPNNTRNHKLAIDLTSSSPEDSVTPSGGGVKGALGQSGLESPRHYGGGKPQLHGHHEVATPRSAVGDRATSAFAANISFPPRPGHYIPDCTAQPVWTPTGAGTTTKVDCKNFTLETPSAAVVYPQNKPADFSPWTGNHPEDNLSEQTIKSGYQNKPLIASEANTARVSLWSPLKNKSGLQTLSSLFVTILEKRQTAGRLTAPSTFKPPPRVALTTTKREAWLRDLANPAIALRRLNRTVPYNVSGKVLLEQCLSKNVPTSRAVWLAKCIGANELRGFKRKGASGGAGLNGEVKWVREWTAAVEQFVESTAGNCGEEGWKAKMVYVTRLASHLFAEQLLDHEHFLDWLISTFETSTLDRLPLWIIQIQIYWKKLVSNRRRGRRLAECLFAHLNTASEDGNELLAPIFQRIQLLLTTLAVAHSGCLILPKIWEKYKHLLDTVPANSDSLDFLGAIQTVRMRNERLGSPSYFAAHEADISPGRKVLDILDNAGVEISINALASRCLNHISDISRLVPVILQWSSSIYREGAHRIYIAARLLRRYKSLNGDIETAIITFVSEMQEGQGVDAANIFRVVAELVRSKHFSVSHFLRSLVATGALLGSQQSSKHLVALLTDLPVDDLPEHISNLRLILLNKAGHDGFKESEKVGRIQRTVNSCCMATSKAMPRLYQELDQSLRDLSLCCKLELSKYLRQRLILHMQEPRAGEPECTVTAQEFFIIRDIVEQFCDYTMLADIAGIGLTSSNTEVLTSVVEILSFRHHVLAAIGALRPLLEKTISRYQSLRLLTPLSKAFLLSLVEVSRILSLDPQLQIQLSYDISRSEAKGVAMCSPASDNAAEVLQTTGDSDEALERILSSGTTMDEQSMTRVFKKITARLEEESQAPYPTRLGGLFCRLRAFDEAGFDGMQHKWLSQLLSSPNRSLCRYYLPALIGAGCLTMAGFLQAANEAQSQVAETDNDARVGIELEVLEAFLPKPTTIFESTPVCGQGSSEVYVAESQQDVYRYRIKARQFVSVNRFAVFQRLRQTIDLCQSGTVPSCSLRMGMLLINPALMSLLKDTAINSRDVLMDSLFLPASSTDSNTPSMTKQILDRLLDPFGRLGFSTLSRQNQIIRLVEIADDLSFPFCEMQVRYLLAPGSEALGMGVGLAPSLFAAICGAMDEDRCVWAEIISSLSSDVALKIREHAEVDILAIVTDVMRKMSVPDTDRELISPTMDSSLLKKYLRVVDSTSKSVSSDCAPRIAAAFAEKLKVIVYNLSASEPGDRAAVNETPEMLRRSVAKSTQACNCIEALLHLLTIHKDSFWKTNPSVAGQATLMSTLCSLLTNPELQRFPSTVERVFDVASYFSDDLPDNLRMSLAKIEGTKHCNDPRIAFLFGSAQNPDDWLGLITSATGYASSAGPSAALVPAARTPTGQLQQRQQQILRTAPAQRPGASPSQMHFNPPVPFPLRRWELLPDQSNNTSGNDTPISLSLFKARKV
ncbi:hypothetical protein EJ06DRAFT_582173 [Trichodelitschia bisporula]|uniref:Mediator of RNA polymerase II transcription subunit 12 n=1 Tax=Trichodelitschia bisporula TaxID=703511 RepID=A0A6G1HWM0_9PEZI|nr:hypothetical protein EJ06DRAFT_582173 [Trichodelitschia bisporula]